MNPEKTWPPAVEYQRVARQAALARQAVGGGANPTEVGAAEKVLRAKAEARIRLDRATEQLPLAEPDPQQPGHVINPFTNVSLDVQGVKRGTRVRDPSDPDPTHVFRVP